MLYQARSQVSWEAVEGQGRPHRAFENGRRHGLVPQCHHILSQQNLHFYHLHHLLLVKKLIRLIDRPRDRIEDRMTNEKYSNRQTDRSHLFFWL